MADAKRLNTASNDLKTILSCTPTRSHCMPTGEKHELSRRIALECSLAVARCEQANHFRNSVTVIEHAAQQGPCSWSN
eukprot:1093853-Amphidinium_carterae.1